MKVTLGPLARSAFEAQPGNDLTASVRAALLHYLYKLKNGRPPADYPDFLPSPSRDVDRSIEVEIEVDQRLEAEIERKAADQGTNVSDLASHAVLIYLAEIDRAESRGAERRGR